MWDFRTKRHSGEQQWQIECVLDAQDHVLVLYEQAEYEQTQSASLVDELDAVWVSL